MSWRKALSALLLPVVAIIFAIVPSVSAASGGKDRLGSQIANRLNSLGDTTFAMTDPGYFYKNPVLPQQAFYANAGCRQSFRFVVNVYKTPAQAAAMYDYFFQHVVNMGGDFHAFNMVRKGRVIYIAETAAAPDPSAPRVPTRDFHSLASEVNGPLPLHPHGCTPKASDL